MPQMLEEITQLEEALLETLAGILNGDKMDWERMCSIFIQFKQMLPYYKIFICHTLSLISLNISMKSGL